MLHSLQLFQIHCDFYPKFDWRKRILFAQFPGLITDELPDPGPGCSQQVTEFVTAPPPPPPPLRHRQQPTLLLCRSFRRSKITCTWDMTLYQHLWIMCFLFLVILGWHSLQTLRSKTWDEGEGDPGQIWNEFFCRRNQLKPDKYLI